MKTVQTILIFFSITFFASLNAQTFVNINANGDNDGTTWDNAYTNLQDALENANANDEIWVAKGTYLPHNTITLPSAGNSKKTFHINKDLKIYGGFAGTEVNLNDRNIADNSTILSGDFNDDDIADDFENNRSDNAINVIYVESTVTTASTLDGFNIVSGHAAGDTLYLTDLRGGGVFSWGAIHISNCIFSQNFANKFGGGLYYRDGAAAGGKVSDCTFEKNACLDSGAGMIAALSGLGEVTVDNCQFDENTAELLGGGLYTTDTDVITTNCSFTNNNAGISGAAIHYARISTTTTKNCTFTNNHSTEFGAVYLWSNQDDANSYLSSATFENCVFENNSGQVGGGFGSWCANFDLKDCTFSNNQALTNDIALNTLGGAIFFQFQPLTNKRSVSIIDCDFVDNSSELEGGAIAIYDGCTLDQSNELSIDKCYFEGNSSPNTGALSIGNLSNEASISNSIFTNNSGGVVHAIGGGNPSGVFSYFNLDINNCLFTNHIATSNLQPIIGFGRFTSSISNCTFADNESSDLGIQDIGDIRISNNIFKTPTNYFSIGTIGSTIDEVITSGGGNLFVDNTLFSDNTAADMLLDIDLQNVDPLFEFGSYQLSEDSPGVDAGLMPDNAPDFDLAGNARSQGSCIDIGAYESSHDADRACAMLTNTREVLATATTIEIYPNPVKDQTTLLLENDWQGDIQVRIVNLLGQVQSIQTIEKMEEQFQLDIDTRDLVQGHYKVLISNGTQMATSSFVKM